MIYSTIRQRYLLCSSSEFKGRWAQRIVFINKKDVAKFSIVGGRISFILKENTSGVPYEYSRNLLETLGNSEYEIKNSDYYYKHNVQVPLGDLANMQLFLELANSNYFAGLLDNKGRVFIFGFQYGLKPENDLYNAHLLNVVTLSSQESGLEQLPPLLLHSNNPKKDFENNFTNNELLELGDFNNDFNNDFFL